MVTTALDAGILTITIRRPEKLNALNAQVVEALDSAFQEAAEQDEARGVILTGSGDRAFVAGADIGALAEMDTQAGVAVSRRGQALLNRIEQLGKPVIAAVNGYALGGGCELALACHLRVADEKARFGLPEVSLGIIPGYGGTVRLARIVGLGRALEMILSGDMVDAAQAREIGLANIVAPAGESVARSRKLMRRILRHGPVALSLALQSTLNALDVPREAALSHEASLFGVLASTRDMREGMSAFLEKRKPEFQGR